MQEEFVAEMLLRLYLFCQNFLHRTGRSAAIPMELHATGAAVLSQVEHSAFTTLFLGI